MLCEKCKQRDALVHITEINHVTSHEVQRHFCASCAEDFQQSDIVRRMLRRVPMIKFRVSAVSPERIRLNVVGGRHDGENWSFVADRLRQFQIDPDVGYEFEMQEDEAYIDWLKGKRPKL